MKKWQVFLLICGISIIVFFLFSNKFLKKETSLLSPADAIIVLGYPSLDNGEISPLQKSRVDQAIALYKKELAPKIIFTGGAVQNQFIEAHTMKDYAVKNGISEETIILETASQNTEENVIFSLEILNENNFTNIIVITSNYHTRRSFYLFSQYPLDIQMQGVPYPSDYGYLFKAQAIVVEYLGFFRYLLKNA